ncbi:MAG: hypothetical protein NT169_00570 [Chloroflexi bacterium]|nr:hypothetical protein [Chloroflexota bacterium]
MRRMKVGRIVALGLVLVGALLLGQRDLARAENFGPGGGSRIIAGDQVIGPYQILATVSPEPAQTGMVTFAVRVSDPATGDKLRDVQVAVKLVHGESKAELTGEATHKDAGNAVDYVAHMTIEQAGTWNGTLTVAGAAGKVELPFIQRVAAPRGFSTVILVGIPFAVVLAVLGGYWYLHTGARR